MVSSRRPVPPTPVKLNPVKYMLENDIKCRKFNYSVPSSYDDKEILFKLSKDEKVFEICNHNETEPMFFGTDKKVEIDQIKGFIFGAFSTRFWMMRIGLNDKIADHIEKRSE
jgi:hypothetical protein